MITLNEISTGILEVREAVNSLQVKGKENAELLVYAIIKCDSILGGIRQLVEDLSKNQNGVEEVDKKVNGDNSNFTKTD